MLRCKRQVSPQSWAERHGALADYYERLREGLQLAEAKQPRDPDWQSHTLSALYHRLCQAPQKHLSAALNGFLTALKRQRSLAERWSEVILQAGDAAAANETRG